MKQVSNLIRGALTMSATALGMHESAARLDPTRQSQVGKMKTEPAIPTVPCGPTEV